MELYQNLELVELEYESRVLWLVAIATIVEYQLVPDSVDDNLQWALDNFVFVAVELVLVVLLHYINIIITIIIKIKSLFLLIIFIFIFTIRQCASNHQRANYYLNKLLFLL